MWWAALFSIDPSFYKPFHDPVADAWGFAATWSTGFTGTHGSRADFVVSSVSQIMDGFLDEYLRVNEAACADRVSQTSTGARPSGRLNRPASETSGMCAIAGPAASAPVSPASGTGGARPSGQSV